MKALRIQSGSVLYFLCAGVCLGLLLGLWGAWLIAAGACLLFALVLLFFGRSSAPALMYAAVLAVIALGIIRADFFVYFESQETLTDSIGTAAVVTGRVADDPDRRDTSLHVTLAVETINGTAAKGKLLALLPPEQKVAYGERLSVRGSIIEPQSFATNGGRLFDYPGYLRAQGISAVVPKAVVVSREEAGWSIRGSLFMLKHRFESSLESVFPAPRAGLLEGLLLGEKRGLPQELTDAFVRSGLIHVVVLSGYNISVIASAIFYVLAFLPQALSATVGGTSIILFALMTGGGAATIRACIMALIAILARYLNRPSAALRALGVAAAGMALWNPLSLLYDTGFILSVLATFGLITLSPFFERKLWFIPNPKRFDIRSIAASTLSVQVYVLPALLYFTGVFSLVSLPANMLALPAVSSAMFFGFFGTLGNFASFYLALPFALLADLLLRWMLFIATVAAAVPWGASIIPAFPAWLAIAAYAPLTVLAIRLYQKEVRSRPSGRDEALRPFGRDEALRPFGRDEASATRFDSVEQMGSMPPLSQTSLP